MDHRPLSWDRRGWRCGETWIVGGRSARAGKTRPDKPWRRPGAVRYALRRVPGLLRPPVDVYEPGSGF